MDMITNQGKARATQHLFYTLRAVLTLKYIYNYTHTHTQSE